MPGAGASSITFWCRRCSEQSRSNRWTTLPWLSPNTCTSMWRGRSMYFSRITRSSPKLDAASRLQLSSASSKSVGAIDPPHALAAAARDRLDQHRIADLARLFLERRRATGPRRDSPVSPAPPPRPSASWPRPSAPSRGCWPASARPRPARRRSPPAAKSAFSRQEAVARVDRLGPGRLGRGDDPLADQIAFARRRRADMHRLVRLRTCSALRVGVRINRHRPNARAVRAVRITRQAISPRLAMSSDLIIQTTTGRCAG